MAAASKDIRIVDSISGFEREKLLFPFGFKGGYLTELWQTVVQLKSAEGFTGTGLGTQSVLYGDADLFSRTSETEGNALMYLLTNSALQLVMQTSFDTPIDLLEEIMPDLVREGIEITGKRDLNVNFLYNSLVPVDNAAWLIYAAENNLKTFDDMIPRDYKGALASRNSRIGVLYQISYGLDIKEVIKAAEQGYFVFKIKTGHPGIQEEMIALDMERLSQIHAALKDFRTPNTADGKLIYTMDANGRYATKDHLQRYLDHARKIGALDQILFYEEPFSELNDEDVSDIEVRIAGDESVNDEASAVRRIEQGYKAIVLKGIAKTLSLSMKIAKIASEHGVPCICSDLTVNPILVDWHKNLAARIEPFPGTDLVFMETNGDMNYRNWQQMKQYHPAADASWTRVEDGMFLLGKDFYEKSGGIFDPIPHYQSLVRPENLEKSAGFGWQG